MTEAAQPVPTTWWDRMRANARTITGAILLALFIRIVLFEAFEIEGPSMMPTLLSGDRVVVAKFMYGLFLPFTDHAMLTWAYPSAGDVVIVSSPRDNIDIVKRVIGLPGDVIEFRENQIWVNGKALILEPVGPCDEEELSAEDPYDLGALDPYPSVCRKYVEQVGDITYLTSRDDDWIYPSTSTTVPPGHVFVLGDHRDRSNDSRALGPIPIERLKGEALFIYWSSLDSRVRHWLPKIRWPRLGISVR